MHRSKLIADLESYRRQHPAESATVLRFLGLVRGNRRCFHRDCLPGHITASAWLVHQGQPKVLLTHHRKLNQWLQPGGHCDGHPCTLDVAMREAREETGIEVRAYSTKPLDIDIHEIPALGPEPEHYHFDVRYALVAKSEKFSVSNESNALAWAPFAQLTDYTAEPCMLRMLAKWRKLRRKSGKYILKY